MARRSAQHRAPTPDFQLASMRAAVREGTTDRPGVYRMISTDGEVVYVGKSKRLRTRLLGYFRCAYPKAKSARILREAHHIEWDYVPSEFAALLRELELIKRYRPRLNVQMMRDAHHYAFIKMTRGAAPKLLVTRGPGSDEGGVYYGPFFGAQRIGEAVRELSDALGLRDCSLDTRMHFADQREMFNLPRTPGCIRLEIGKCLGPCVGACSEQAYAARVEQARAFLDGANDGPIESIRAQMMESSDRLEFERAAALRDKVERLEALREQFSQLRFAVETLSFIYPVAGHGGDDRVYLIRRGCVRAERPQPKTARERAVLDGLASEIFAGEGKVSASVPTHEIDELLLLSSWFRRFPHELEQTQPVKEGRRALTA